LQIPGSPSSALGADLPVRLMSSPKKPIRFAAPGIEPRLEAIRYLAPRRQAELTL
jgi:hypothetical protein